MLCSPLPTTGHSLEQVDDEIVCFGGLRTACSSPPQPLVGRIRPNTAPARTRAEGPAGVPRASNALHAYSLSGQSWSDREAENSGPCARSGHACASLSKSVLLIFGGADEKHRKLDDVWKLETRREQMTASSRLELWVDAWSVERVAREKKLREDAEAARAAAAAEAAAAEAAAAKAAKGKKGGAAVKKGEKAKVEKAKDKGPGSKKGGAGDKGGAADEPEFPEMKDALQLKKLAKVLAAGVGLPSECLEVTAGADATEPAADANGEGSERGMQVWVRVKPVVGIGLQTFGVDGQSLPAAAMAKIEQLLQLVLPHEIPAEVVPEKKSKKESKVTAEEAAAKAKALRVQGVAQQRLLGYPLFSWTMHTEVVSEVVPCLLWSRPEVQPAAEAEGPTVPQKRSGHTLSRLREEMILFGGSGDHGLFGDVWKLALPALAWSRPTTQGKVPCPRAYHSASARSPKDVEGTGGTQQVIIFGGSDGKRRLADLYVLSVPAFVWSMPVVEGTPPPARCWHTSAGLTAANGTYRVLLYGGIDSHGAALRDCWSLLALTQPEPPPPVEDTKKGKGKKDTKKDPPKKDPPKKDPPPKKGKDGKEVPPAAPPPPPPEEEKGPPEFKWKALPASPPSKLEEQEPPPMLSFASSWSVPKGTFLPSGPRCVATEDAVLIFGGGLPIPPLHLWTCDELLPLEDPAAARDLLASQPGLRLRNVSVSLYAISDDEISNPQLALRLPQVELSRSPLLLQDSRLELQEKHVALSPTISVQEIELEVWVCRRVVALAPLSRLFDSTSGSALNAPLQGPNGGEVGSISFSLEVVGLSTSSRQPAQSAVGVVKGGGADEYVGPFVANVRQGHGVCTYASGARYEGDWKDGMRHGQGELREATGSVYRGGFEYNKPAGVGAWHYADGSWYKGPLVNGLQHGFGEFRGADGSSYLGEWLRGKRWGEGEYRQPATRTAGSVYFKGLMQEDKKHGYGILVIQDLGPKGGESVFEGNWNMDVRQGHGKMTMSNGDVFEGEWQNDRRNGIGELVSHNGDRYVGKWINDKRHGKGKQTWERGAKVYEGLWENDAPHGYGVCKYANGDVYDGEWRMGKKHGQGSMKRQGTLEAYTGTWDHDERQGVGEQVYANGDVYQGHFHDGVRSGTGTLMETSGATYEGKWLNGLQHGFGEHRAKGAVYKGEWVAGHRCGKGICTYGNGDEYIGEWKADARSGEGKLTRKTQIGEEVWREFYSYEGSWSNGVPNGQGKSVAAPPPDGDGETYEGSWLRGQRHGIGKCVYHDGECYIGDWRHGERQGIGSLAFTAED